MTGKEFVGRTRALVPALRARARQAEQLRRLPEETFREFQDAGLFRALQPARFGGFELEPASFYEAVIEIGTACASSAWVLAVLGVHPWHIALFPPQAQEEVWGQDPRAVASSSYPLRWHILSGYPQLSTRVLLCPSTSTSRKRIIAWL